MKSLIASIAVVTTILSFGDANADDHVKLPASAEVLSVDKLLTGKEASHFFGTLGDGHELTRVVVRLKKWRSDARDYEEFETTCEVDRRDEMTLKATTNGVVRSRWGRKTPGSSGAVGAYPQGEIVLESKAGRCRIFLQGRFYLDTGGCCEYEDAFESWTLARVVDELLKEKQGKGLSDKDFKLYSGEKGIENEKDSFEKLWRGQKDEE